MASTYRILPANWRKQASWISLTNIILLFLLTFAQGQTSNSRSEVLQECTRGIVKDGHIFRKGKNAGVFTRLGRADTAEKCVEICCGDSLCQVALFLKDSNKPHGSCYAVKCKDRDSSCNTIPVKKSHLTSSIFIRNPDNQRPVILQSVGDITTESNKTLIREKSGSYMYFKIEVFIPKQNLAECADNLYKGGANSCWFRIRHESCHHYHGHTCSSYLEKGKLLYFNKYPPSVEKALASPFKLIQNRLSKGCMKYALPAICLTAFPHCSKKSKPNPNYLCRKDCENLYSGVCVDDFKIVKGYQSLAKILPDCDRLPISGSPEAKNCIKIGVPDPVSDLDIDQNLMTGAAAGEEREEETGDAGGVGQDQALDSLGKTTNQPTASLLITDKPVTIPTISAGGQQVTQTDTLAGGVSPPGAKGRISPSGATNALSPSRAVGGAEGKDAILPTQDVNSQKNTLQHSQIRQPSNVEINENKAEGVNEKMDLSSEESDLETPVSQPQLANEKNAQGRTSNVKAELDQNFERQQSDSSTKEGSKSLANNGLSGGAENKTNKLQESLGILDPGQRTTLPRDSHPATVAGQQSGYTAAVSTIPSVQPHSPEFNETETIKEKKNLPEPTVSSLPNHPPTTTTPSLHSPSATPATREKPDLTPGTVKRPSVAPPTAATPLIRPSQSQRTELSPSLVVINSSGAEPETNFAQSSGNVTVTSQPKKDSLLTTLARKKTEKVLTKAPSTTPPPLTLQVSAGNNKQIILPANTVSLYASAWPKEKQDHPYSYHWQQISAPHSSHGYMQGQETKQVTLTQLDKPGVYQFKVKVTGPKHAIGFAYVNVTVKPAPRVNKPPRADISPREQSITLPTNEVVLDGRKSSDDDKIVQYKWEEVKGPLNDKNKVISSGSDSPILQLKSLVPGVYTFKLTVVDSDGATDSTTATVTVNNEKDYPPVARAGHDVVLTLPLNYVTLLGNSSTDDKGVASYEWSKSPTSPPVGDMQGTTTAFLKVSNLVVGDYTFILKVTDARGQSDTTKVTVVVQPEKNEPPVAKAGSDKDLVFPDDTTTLDAKDSRDDQKIVKYLWEQIQGPAQAEMVGSNRRVVTLKKLQEGHYVFKLTVTDQKGFSGHDEVAVNVKKDINTPPVASAGPDIVVHLPNRAAELDGSRSTDDQGVAEYLWTRDPKSPAAGDVINNSDHQSVLRLSNLVEGMYKFKLTVADNKGLKSSDEAIITVKEDEHSAHLVELYLDVDITRFSEENKEQLIRKLAVILNVEDQAIIVEHIKEAGTGHSVVVMFYVREKESHDPRDGQDVSEVLKEKIENEEGFFEFRMLKVDPYICRNNCSGHGYCDRRTKLCVCESFWMQDIFKASFGAKESNCDWSILYVTVIIFGIIMGVGGVIWGVCFCMGRYRRKKVVSVDPPALEETQSSSQPGRRSWRGKRRHRYAIIDDDDDDEKAESMEMLPKGKYFNSSMMLSDSDEDSDEETTLFEAKKRVMNGHSLSNGFIGRKDS